MLIDLINNTIFNKQYDICIIGGGIAGLTIANELKNKNVTIAILESGNFDFDEKIQSLYKGEVLSTSAPHAELDVFRRRQYGGTSHMWGGGVLPLDEIDFEYQDYIKGSGWPITRKDLNPYYGRAMRYFGVGDNVDDYDTVSPIIQDLEKSKVLQTKMWKLTPSNKKNFSNRFKRNLYDRSNVDIYINANCTDLNPTNNEKLVEVKTLSGVVHTIKARKFIISMGGIETTRLLMLSSFDYGDNVGRYYTPHWNSNHGLLLIRPDKLVSSQYERTSRGYRIRRFLTLNEEFAKMNGLLNVKITLEKIVTDNDMLEDIQGYFNYLYGIDVSLLDLADNVDLKQFSFSEEGESAARRVFRYSRNLVNKYINFNVFEYYCALGQKPNVDSTLTLSNKLDDMGQRTVQLDYKVSEDDKESLIRTYHLIGKELGQLGVGRMMFNPDIAAQDFIQSSHGSSHHCGTTRMADSLENGVVDANLKLFKSNNKYICSSSVFPITGHANPTLTIAALGIRLADYITKKV